MLYTENDTQIYNWKKITAYFLALTPRGGKLHTVCKSENKIDVVMIKKIGTKQLALTSVLHILCSWDNLNN